jgi:hypothetical protein
MLGGLLCPSGYTYKHQAYTGSKCYTRQAQPLARLAFWIPVVDADAAGVEQAAS